MKVTESNYDFKSADNKKKQWPFVDMAVGEKVAIHGLDDLSKASRYAHNIGSQYGRKFKTRSVDGVLHVMRVK